MELILKYFTDFTAQQIGQLTALEGLYREWNSQINVISRKDIDSLYERHVLHSLSIAAIAPFKPGVQIADIGTGGGFPGIPLAIFFPEVEFLLVDSIGKKLKVAEAVARETGLANITTRHSRIEDIKDRKFDYTVSRAVAPLKDLWKWSAPVLKKKSADPELPNGLICLKGGDLATEISESGKRPRLLEVFDLFKEPFFEEKFLLYIT